MGASFFLRRRARIGTVVLAPALTGARNPIRSAADIRLARDAHVKLKSRLPQPAARVQ